MKILGRSFCDLKCAFRCLYARGTPRKRTFLVLGKFVAHQTLRPCTEVIRSSKDAVINVWDLRDPSDNEPPSSNPPHALTYLPTSAQADLTSLDWNPEGTLLAAGSYDTYLRVCDTSGQLYFAESLQKVCTLILYLVRALNSLEKGPIFATRFSPSGQYLLTASIDGTVCAWNIPKKALHKQYYCHERKHSYICS